MLRTALLICLTATLQSCCATNTASNYCAVATPIYVSPGDELTDSTAKQILAHQEKGRELCGWPRHRA